MPFDPDAWIMHHYGSPFYNSIVATPRVPKEPKEPDNVEHLICEYVVLAVIHDCLWKKPKSQKLIEIDDGNWVDNLWNSIEWFRQVNGDNYVNRIHNINQALKNVETDLDRKASKTKPDVNLASDLIKALKQADESLEYWEMKTKDSDTFNNGWGSGEDFYCPKESLESTISLLKSLGYSIEAEYIEKITAALSENIISLDYAYKKNNATKESYLLWKEKFLTPLRNYLSTLAQKFETSGLKPSPVLAVSVQSKPDNTGNSTEPPKQTRPEQQIKLVNEPSKEAAQAYKLYYGTGKNQTEVAKIMTQELRRPVSQGQVSKWVSQYKDWAKVNNIPISEKPTIINMDSNKLSMGKRTDGRITGDPRHKAKVDPDGDAYE